MDKAAKEDCEPWSKVDCRVVGRWLVREADDRLRFFPQRADGVDALLRHLASSMFARANAAVEEGLHRKYNVRRLNDPDGKHVDCRYFVLDPEHDPIAVRALMEYAAWAGRAGQHDLEGDLRTWINALPDPSKPPVHNHAPWDPMCSERRLPDGVLRGVCMDSADEGR